MSDRELQVGDFENPEQAKNALIEHLRKAIDYVGRNGIECPACVGIIARTLEMVCYRTPTICDDAELVETDFDTAYHMFHSAFCGDWSDEGIQTALGFDRALSDYQYSIRRVEANVRGSIPVQPISGSVSSVAR